ncbi:MAG: hypothetical protein ABW252_05645 [Polyangiales bacterium]
MRIGSVLVAIAVLHLVLSLVLFHAQVGLLLDRGVVMGASAICLLGACMLFVERRGLPLPTSVVLGLVALAVALVLSMDRGGAPWQHSLAAWLVAPFALRALRRGPRLVGLAKRWPAR